MASWHGRDLTSVLEELHQKAEELMRNKPSGELPPVRPQGNSEEEIKAHEKHLGRPIPEPVRQMYKIIDGIDWHFEDISTGGTLLLKLQNTMWLDPEYESELCDLDKKWKRNDYFGFAQSISGDWIVYCENPPDHTTGSIILLDHECGNQIMSEDKPDWYTPIVFIADNLAEWIARWISCRFNEFAYSFNDDDFPDVQQNYLEDHLRLNPTVQWAREKLEKLEQLDGL